MGAGVLSWDNGRVTIETAGEPVVKVFLKGG
jgi:hypothetical protein